MTVKAPNDSNIEAKAMPQKIEKMLCHKTTVFHSGFMGGIVFLCMCLFMALMGQNCYCKYKLTKVL